METPINFPNTGYRKPTINSLIREFLVFQLKYEVVFWSRDPYNRSFDRFLIFIKSPPVSTKTRPEEDPPESCVLQDDFFQYYIDSLLKNEPHNIGELLEHQIIAPSKSNSKNYPMHIFHANDLNFLKQSIYLKKEYHLEFFEYRIPSIMNNQFNVSNTLTMMAKTTPTHGYGLLGLIRLLQGYFAIIITSRLVVSQLGGRYLYSVESILSVPCYYETETKENNYTDSRYIALLDGLFSSRSTFFYSYEWDLTRTLQQQCADSPDISSFGHAFDSSKSFIQDSFNTPTVSNVSSPNLKHERIGHVVAAVNCDSRFVFNAFLLKPILSSSPVLQETESIQIKSESSLTPPIIEWLVPIIQGAIQQTTLKEQNRLFSLTVISRRSRYHVGPRYFKRGINSIGRVANEVECEQILWESQPYTIDTSSCHHCSLFDQQIHNTHINTSLLTSSLQTQTPSVINDLSHDTQIMGFGSFVMMRGSIPLFWGHENSTSIKPKIQLHLELDPDLKKTIMHFNDLFSRYGSPITVLNLVCQSDDTHSETALSNAFQHAIEFLNQQQHGSTMHHNSIILNSSIHETVRHDDEDDVPFMSQTTRLCSSQDDTHSDYNHLSQQHIHYIAYDWLGEEKRLSFDIALRQLFKLAIKIVETTGFYIQTLYSHHDKNRNKTWHVLQNNTIQRQNQLGIVRINCVDCLDRTNLGMFALGQEALRQQLILLNTMSDNTLINSVYHLSKDTLQRVCDLWGSIGDQLSSAYAGSPAMHRAEILSYPGHQIIMPPTHKTCYTESNISIITGINKNLSTLPSGSSCFERCWGSTYQSPLKTLQVDESVKSTQEAEYLKRQHDYHLNNSSLSSELLVCDTQTDKNTAHYIHNEETDWIAVKRSNITIAVQRYLHNVFSDLDRQRALHLLLGKYQPRIDGPSIWDLDLFPTKYSMLREVKHIQKNDLKTFLDKHGSNSGLTTTSTLLNNSGDYIHNERHTSCIGHNGGDALCGWAVNWCGMNTTTQTMIQEPDVEIEIPAINATHPVMLLHMDKRNSNEFRMDL